MERTTNGTTRVSTFSRSNIPLVTSNSTFPLSLSKVKYDKSSLWVSAIPPETTVPLLRTIASLPNRVSAAMGPSMAKLTSST